MSDLLRLGIIGAGQIGHIACEEIRRHDAARIAAVSDLDALRLAALADKFEVPVRFLDPEALLAHEEVDAVYIATPNASHAPLALAALKQGKHVLLEKPFALNAVEAAAVVDEARQRGLTLSVGMNQRFRGDCQKVRELVRRGSLGDVYRAQAYWQRRSGIPKLGTWFGKKSLSGGGALLDIGVHLLDLSLYVLDNFHPASVSGRTYTVFGQRGLGEGGWGYSDRVENGFDVEDSATALIKLENGATLNLTVSWAGHQATGDRMNVELYGSEGGATCYPAELYGFGDGGSGYRLAQDLKVPVRFPHASRFANFANAVLGREELCVTPEQALTVQRIIDAIYESSASGREVVLARAGS